jgi:hypothetical protein
MDSAKAFMPQGHYSGYGTSYFFAMSSSAQWWQLML